MKKTKEDLELLKKEYDAFTNKLKELNEDELNDVIGGFFGPSGGEVPFSNQDIADRALLEQGKPYQWGAVGPDSYDDSGLVSYAISGVHCRIGTCSTFMGWSRVSSPSPGDICVSPVHCGIYIGSNSMVHAPTFGQTVCVSSIDSDMIFVKPRG